MANFKYEHPEDVISPQDYVKPVSFTHPVWFILPKLLHQSILESLKNFISEEKRKEVYDKLEIKL